MTALVTFKGETVLVMQYDLMMMMAQKKGKCTNAMEDEKYPLGHFGCKENDS